MRKNVTIGFTPAEFIRLQGAAAVTNMPLATYLKWLLRGGSAADASGNQMNAVLQRLDSMAVALARLSNTSTMSVPQRVQSRDIPSRDVVEAKLRERGIPTSTIRQLYVVLDELGVTR